MNLYEMKYKKCYDLKENKNSNERVHQIPAKNELQACVELGRIFNSEAYELEIVWCRKVK